MAEFSGWTQGNRGETTRLGSKKSGIVAGVKSWQTKCIVGMRKDEEGKDLIGFSVRKLSREDNLGNLDIELSDFENNQNISINGIKLNKLLEAYKIVNFPKNLEIKDE